MLSFIEGPAYQVYGAAVAVFVLTVMVKLVRRERGEALAEHFVAGFTFSIAACVLVPRLIIEQANEIRKQASVSTLSSSTLSGLADAVSSQAVGMYFALVGLLIVMLYDKHVGKDAIKTTPRNLIDRFRLLGLGIVLPNVLGFLALSAVFQTVRNP